MNITEKFSKKLLTIKENRDKVEMRKKTVIKTDFVSRKYD